MVVQKIGTNRTIESMALQTSTGPEAVERESGSVMALLIASTIFFSMMGGLAVATLLSDSVPDHYIVVGTPLQSRDDMIEIVGNAAGSITGLGGFRNILTAASSEVGFKENLEKAGAWLVLPAPRALGCGAANEAGAAV